MDILSLEELKQHIGKRSNSEHAHDNPPKGMSADHSASRHKSPASGDDDITDGEDATRVVGGRTLKSASQHRKSKRKTHDDYDEDEDDDGSDSDGEEVEKGAEKRRGRDPVRRESHFGSRRKPPTKQQLAALEKGRLARAAKTKQQSANKILDSFQSDERLKSLVMGWVTPAKEVTSEQVDPPKKAKTSEPAAKESESKESTKPVLDETNAQTVKDSKYLTEDHLETLLARFKSVEESITPVLTYSRQLAERVDPQLKARRYVDSLLSSHKPAYDDSYTMKSNHLPQRTRYSRF